MPLEKLNPKAIAQSEHKPAISKKTTAINHAEVASDPRPSSLTSKHSIDANKASAAVSASRKIGTHITNVIATVDVGWGNALYIRGEGAGLSWDKGILMENMGADRWEWKTSVVHEGIRFKLILNDTSWSTGEDIFAVCGGTSISAPIFE